MQRASLCAMRNVAVQEESFAKDKVALFNIMQQEVR